MNREVTPEMIRNAAAEGQLIPAEDWLVVGMEVAGNNVVLVRFNEGPYYSLTVHDAGRLSTSVRDATHAVISGRAIPGAPRDPDEEETHVSRPLPPEEGEPQC